MWRLSILNLVVSALIAVSMFVWVGKWVKHSHRHDILGTCDNYGCACSDFEIENNMTTIDYWLLIMSWVCNFAMVNLIQKTRNCMWRWWKIPSKFGQVCVFLDVQREILHDRIIRLVQSSDRASKSLFNLSQSHFTSVHYSSGDVLTPRTPPSPLPTPLYIPHPQTPQIPSPTSPRTATQCTIALCIQYWFSDHASYYNCSKCYA